MKPSKIKIIIGYILYPSDNHDITHIRIGGEVGKEVEVDLVKMHYHYYNVYYSARKHINYALQIAIRQHRTLEEVADLADRVSRNFSEEGIILADAREEWGAI